MLKKPKPSQKGLKKLPTELRNKMGYMKDGGSLYDIAKKRKSSGRSSADDLKKAEEMMEKRPSKFTVGRERSRLPMQTGPRKVPGRDPSRIMKPMPITPKDREKMKDKDMKPLPITPKDRERMKDRIMKPMKAGGAAGQTKSTKRPMQSIFQQLKKAQMRRKMGTMGKK